MSIDALKHIRLLRKSDRIRAGFPAAYLGFAPLIFLVSRVEFPGSVIPAGFALYCASARIFGSKPINAGLILLGMISAGLYKGAALTAVAMALFTAFEMLLSKTPRLDKAPFYAFFSVFMPGLGNALTGTFLVYDLVLIIFNSIIIATLTHMFKAAFLRFAPAAQADEPDGLIGGEAAVGLSLMLTLGVVGLTRVEIYGIALYNVVCVLAILFAGYTKGVEIATVAGVSSGLALCFIVRYDPVLIGAYSFCGLMAGLTRKFGKVPAAIAFLAGNALLLTYLGSKGDPVLNFSEVLVAVLIFLAIPLTRQSKMAVRLGFIGTAPGGADAAFLDRHDRRESELKTAMLSRLSKLADAFKNLAATQTGHTRAAGEAAASADAREITLMFDSVADRACKGCSLVNHCWKLNFYDTYNFMQKIVAKLETKGRISAEDIPAEFISRCGRVERFIDSVNCIYEIFKCDLMWKSRIDENRQLFAVQLTGISGALDNLAAEIKQETDSLADIEKELSAELAKSGHKVREIVAIRNKNGKYEISVQHARTGGAAGAGTMRLAELASKVTGKSMAISDTSGYGETIIVQKDDFGLVTGYASAVKKGAGKISGDSHSVIALESGRNFIVLSDGMGTGKKAGQQSSMALSMFERFVESGFDAESAVKMINSLLLVKTPDDTYATLDVVSIDNSSGDAAFVKVGAVPSFIKRADSVETIRSAALPAGIIPEIRPQAVACHLKNGDYIIMMTDGVYDAFGETVLGEYLETVPESTPQALADRIIASALETTGGRAADDMLVVVARIWKK